MRFLAQVIRVDLLPNRDKVFPIDAPRGAKRRRGLGERDGGAAVKDAERLVRALGYRHGRRDAITGKVQNPNAQGRVQATLGDAVPPGGIGHGTTRGGRVRISASISAISRGALLMRSSPFAVMT